MVTFHFRGMDVTLTGFHRDDTTMTWRWPGVNDNDNYYNNFKYDDIGAPWHHCSVMFPNNRTIAQWEVGKWRKWSCSRATSFICERPRDIRKCAISGNQYWENSTYFFVEWLVLITMKCRIHHFFIIVKLNNDTLCYDKTLYVTSLYD